MPISRNSCRVAGAALLLLAQQAVAQPAYVAPSGETIVSTIVDREGGPPSHAIYVENHSTIPITVYSVNLSACENVRQQCSVHPTNIRVGPGAREVAIRVDAMDPRTRFAYHFGFSWRVDSAGVAALAALADAGNEAARARLGQLRRRDSLERDERGVHYTELSPDDLAALGARAVALRALPESLMLAPGARTPLDRIRVLVVDSQGVALGVTPWLSWRIQRTAAIQFLPGEAIVAVAPGRSLIQLHLVDAVVARLGHDIEGVDLPIIVAYPVDPRAPSFSGVAVDADAGTPIGCAGVALEDSARTVVARGRTDRAGAFVLRAPRPGTYRVRVEAPGWAPAYGPSEIAADGEARQRRYEARFTDQLLRASESRDPDGFQDAYPISISFAPAPSGTPREKPLPGAAPVQRVSLGGSSILPILGVVSRAPAGSVMSQFVVDSTGRIVLPSIQLPAGTDRVQAATLQTVLARVRFAPARDAGKPSCELLRMQIDFTR